MNSYVWLVTIQGIGTKSCYATSKWHAIELTHTKYMSEESDRSKYSAKKN